MNGKKAKRIRKKSRQLVVDWLQTMLVNEERKKVSVNNIEKYLPDETHFYANNKLMVSAYTPRWFAQRIKKSNKNLQDITWQDIESLG
jgi:Fe-S cluster biosynthesis and repair protein YggX